VAINRCSSRMQKQEQQRRVSWYWLATDGQTAEERDWREEETQHWANWQLGSGEREEDVTEERDGCWC
jgi:hypothetical protein